MCCIVWKSTPADWRQPAYALKCSSSGICRHNSKISKALILSFPTWNCLTAGTAPQRTPRWEKSYPNSISSNESTEISSLNEITNAKALDFSFENCGTFNCGKSAMNTNCPIKLLAKMNETTDPSGAWVGELAGYWCSKDRTNRRWHIRSVTRTLLATLQLIMFEKRSRPKKKDNANGQRLLSVGLGTSIVTGRLL